MAISYALWRTRFVKTLEGGGFKTSGASWMRNPITQEVCTFCTRIEAERAADAMLTMGGVLRFEVQPYDPARIES